MCTCGARLPDDARFCHKCGKPQYGEPPPEYEPVAAIATAPPVDAANATAPPINFHNGAAVRTGFLAALIALALMVLTIHTGLGLGLCLGVLLGGGFLAVYLYMRLTGQSVSVSSGARLGWIAGVLLFGIFIPIFTMGVVELQSQGGLVEHYRKQLEAVNTPAMRIEEQIQLMQMPGMVAGTILLTIALSFAVLTLSMIAGGALAAKVLARE